MTNPANPTEPVDLERAAALGRADRDHLVHGFVPLSRHQSGGLPVFVRAQGIYLWDAMGKRYIDGLSTLWNVHVGHGRTEITRAAAEQMDRLAFAPALVGPASDTTVRLASRLAEMAPEGLTRVVFTSGGSEANESMIRLVRAYWKARGEPRRTRFVTLNQGYHGSSSGAAMLTGIPVFNRQMEPGLPGVRHMARPHCYRCELGKTWPGCELACADELERIVEREGADAVAAFVAEPVQGGGGVVVPPRGWLARIREICDRHGVLMVCDEVITGFGRTGSLFACAGEGVTPDVLVTAKGITSGYLPLGAMLFREELFQTLLAKGDDAFFHGYTYTGHPVACAAALANLDIIERERLVERAAELGPYLQERLATLSDLPAVGHVRGRGLMAAVELVKDKATRDPFAPEEQVGRRVLEEALANGLLLRVCPGDALALCPPLVVTREQIDEMVAVLRDAITAVAADGYPLPNPPPQGGRGR